MGDRTSIEWTESTWNPTTGCDRTSPGCDNCYALRAARRLKAMGIRAYQQDGDPTTSGPGFRISWHTDRLEIPTRWRQPSLVFVNSMSDLFHAEVPISFIESVFDVIAKTPQHRYQLLTKRSKRLFELAPTLRWPDNLWIGVSIESDRYTFRAEHLRAVDAAAVRFLSLEPLLGPLPSLDLTGIDWVIVGGESGPGYRPIEASWVRDLRDQAKVAGIPFFFKQWGGRTPKTGGRTLDGRTWSELPTRPVVMSVPSSHGEV